MFGKKVNLLHYIIFTFCVTCIYLPANAQEITQERIKTINLASQIPESSLVTTTTEQLIEKYLASRYPWYIFIYEDVDKAFEMAFNDFNGLRELLNRDNATMCIVEYYKKMDPTAYNLNWELTKKGSFSFSFLFLELLMSNDLVINNLSDSQTQALLLELLKKYRQKNDNKEIFSDYGVQCNIYAMAKIISLKGKENGISSKLLNNSGMAYFLKTGRVINNEVRPLVLQSILEFLTTN